MVLKVGRWSSPALHSCTIFDVWNCVCFSNLQNIGWNFMWAKIVLEYLYKWASVQFFRSKDQVGSQAGVRGVADQSFIINPNNSNEHGNESWSTMRNAYEKCRWEITMQELLICFADIRILTESHYYGILLVHGYHIYIFWRYHILPVV